MRMSADSMERTVASPADDRDKSLARHCGIAWREQPLTQAHDEPLQQTMAAGLAGLDEAASGFRIALSPSPAGMAALAQYDYGGQHDLVMLPPHVFRAMLRGQRRDQGRDHASKTTWHASVPARRPEHA
jgi:hypothetical protein